ncbi:MAG TPA: metalloregulator ArsR/SmtB family transcription factor [Gemmatimonadales bacterium]|jgi:DNA-binding transcriptional ArsR family regulator
MTYGATLVALADPTRRTIFERLRHQSHTVGELARLTKVSQPGVSQHLRVLRRARLVTHAQLGTRRYYRANREGLVALRRYVEALWEDVLTAYAAADPSPPRRGTPQ